MRSLIPYSIVLFADCTDNDRVLPRQSVNFNSNSNANQGNPDNSNSYSYSSSSSNTGDRGQNSVSYNLNGVSVPQPLTGFRPDTITNACGQLLGGSSGGGGGAQTP